MQTDPYVKRTGQPRRFHKRTRNIPRAPGVQYMGGCGIEERMPWEGLREDGRDFEFRP